MKRLVILIIISLFLIGFISAGITSKVITNNCVDSDNGKNYSIKGTVTTNYENNIDECTYCTGLCLEEDLDCSASCGAVLEFYCEEGIIKSEAHVCEEGKTCEEGVCIQIQEECTSEGNFIDLNWGPGLPCCEGLNAIPDDKIETDNKCKYGSTEISYCTKCGDGQCKFPENKCNCPQDCGGAICGNSICEEREASTKQFLTCNHYNQTYCYYKECEEDCGEQPMTIAENEDNSEEENKTKIGEITEERLNKSQTEKIVIINNKIKATATSEECPESCTCTGSVMKCTLANGREMTIMAGNSGNTIVQVKGENMTTNVTLYTLESKVYGIFYGNKTREIKTFPDNIKENIKTRIKTKLQNENIILNEYGNYEYNAEKRARLFFVIPIKISIKAQINSNTGEISELQQSEWWSFLAKDE